MTVKRIISVAVIRKSEDLHVMEDLQTPSRECNVSENVFGLVGH